MITHERLIELLHYDPKTGEFRWAKSRRGAKRGAVAGSIKKDGHMVITLDREAYAAARIAFFYMTKRWPSPEADHADRDGLNNKWENIREATRVQNGSNRMSRNKTGLKGIFATHYRDKTYYTARIKVDSEQIYLGTRHTAKEAHELYRDAAIRLHGEFACMEAEETR